MMSDISTAEEDGELLPPDETDVRFLLHGELPGCPCCTGTPTTFARFFPHSGIYQSYVHCSHCDVQVFKNARDLDEARRLAIDTWSKRPAALTTRLAPDRTERAREAAEAWRIPANSDGTGELVKPRDHCVWGFEQGYLAALTPATAPDREAIARIIDPDWFGEIIDGRHVLDNYPGQHKQHQLRALTKADAILSLMGEG